MITSREQQQIDRANAQRTQPLVLVHGLYLPNHALGAEDFANSRSSGLAHPQYAFRIAEEAENRLRQLLGVPRGDEQTRDAVLHDLSRTTRI